MTVTTSYTIAVSDALNWSLRAMPLQVDPTSGPITLALPPAQTATAGIAKSKWSIVVLNAANPVTLADPLGQNTIYLGGSTAFTSTTSLSVGVTNLQFDGTHFTFTP